MSTAPVVCVMVGTTPPGHLQPDMPPLNVLTADCVIFSCTVAVPDAGCVNVRAQVEPLVSVTVCLLPLTGSIVLAVVHVPFENSALVRNVVAGPIVAGRSPATSEQDPKLVAEPHVPITL